MCLVSYEKQRHPQEGLYFGRSDCRFTQDCHPRRRRGLDGMAADFEHGAHDSRRRVHQVECVEAIHGHVPRRHPARRDPRRRRAEFRKAQPVLVVEDAAGEARYDRALEESHRRIDSSRRHRPCAEQIHGRASHDGARRRRDAHLLWHPVHRHRKLEPASPPAHHGARAP